LKLYKSESALKFSHYFFSLIPVLDQKEQVECFIRLVGF